jgi:hypothetical protein
MMKWHELKGDPEPFDAMARGDKTHEIRYDDREYQIGDGLLVRRTQYTGSEMKTQRKPLVYSDVPPLKRMVTHIQRGYGLEPGWVILSVKEII